MILPEFLQQNDAGVVQIAGHRIGIEDIVHCYNDGFSPEMLLAEFPTLSLALIHKMLGFYLENRTAVDAYVVTSSRAADEARSAGSKGPTLAELRLRMQTVSSIQPK